MRGKQSRGGRKGEGEARREARRVGNVGRRVIKAKRIFVTRV